MLRVVGGAAVRFRPVARRLSSLAANKTLSLEQALTSNHLIINELESPAAKQQLESVRGAGDILTKWQHANAVLVHATMNVLPQVGYSKDGPGLQAYTDAFAVLMRSDSPEVTAALRSTTESKWRVLLQSAFGCEPAAPIDLAKARAIAIDMVDALQDETLLRQVEESRTG